MQFGLLLHATNLSQPLGLWTTLTCGSGNLPAFATAAFSGGAGLIVDDGGHALELTQTPFWQLFHIMSSRCSTARLSQVCPEIA